VCLEVCQRLAELDCGPVAVATSALAGKAGGAEFLLFFEFGQPPGASTE